MKTFIDTFICDFRDSTNWKMIRLNQKCLSDSHFLYMGLGFLGLCLYYPLSLFMFPNLQFQDKTLDIKYNPSYLVFLQQTKLIVSGLDSFFKSFNPSGSSSSSNNYALSLQFGTSTLLFFFLGMFIILTKPCIIKTMIIFDAVTFFLLFNVIGLLFQYYIKKSTIIIYQ